MSCTGKTIADHFFLLWKKDVLANETPFVDAQIEAHMLGEISHSNALMRPNAKRCFLAH